MRFLALALLAVSCNSPPAPRTAPPASTLDPTVERVVREELDRAVAEWKPSVSIAIVLDARSGAVLAAEGREGARSDAALPTTRTFVTGSTLKTLTFAAAFEEKSIGPDAKVDCATREYPEGALHDASPHGTLTLSEVLAVSSNVGTSRVYDTLGLDRLTAWFRRFHFDDPPSHLPAVPDAKGLRAAMLAAGELAETTPMQMAAAYTAIFNGGTYASPTTDPNQVHTEPLLHPETTQMLLTMLEGAVTTGTGKLARIEGHRVAGKTGTGDHGGNYYGSFVGSVLDAKKPFVILVAFDLPQSSGYTGATVAAPTFARIAKRLL
jgi:cell division protein FtsI (penicillin-binding protein 3)